MNLKVTTITDPEGLESIRESWGDLWHQSGQAPHLSFDWFYAGWETFHVHDQLHVLIVHDENGDCVGVAPLIIDPGVYRGVEIRRIGFARNAQSPCGDFLFAKGSEEASMEGILAHLVSFESWELVDLRKLEVEGTVWRFLNTFLEAKGGRFGIKENLRTPYISIQGEWRDFWQAKPARFRKAMRHKLNRAPKMAKLTCERIVVRSGQEPGLNEMLRVSSRSWKRGVGEDLLTRKDNWRFYKRICDLLGGGNTILLWLLKKEQTAIAFEFHLQVNGVTYPIRADYDENFKELSPGSLLEYEIIKTLFTEGEVSEYNSCGHDYRYLMNWTDRIRTYNNVELFKRSAKMSGLHVLEYTIFPVLRRLRLDLAWRCIKQRVAL